MGYGSGGPWGHGWGVPPMFIGAPQLKINGLRTSRVKMVTMGIERTLSGARYGWGMKKKKKTLDSTTLFGRHFLGLIGFSWGK